MAKLKRAEFSKLLLKLAPLKDQIQTDFDTGRIESITEYAIRNNCSRFTMATILKAIGVNVGRNKNHEHNRIPMKSVLIVIERICQQLDIPYTEIKDYID